MDIKFVKNISTDLIDEIKIACMEELQAQATYKKLREHILQADEPFVKEELLKRIDEIIADEEQHLGSLLYCLNLVDSNIMKNIDKGIKGK
jgi:rubrerythrin